MTSGSLLLVHGAGSGPWIFDDWPADFPGLGVAAVDLQADTAAEGAGMADYADAVVTAGAGLPRPLIVCGWSMGGLVVLMAVARLAPDLVVVIEPSPPAEVQGYRPEHPIRSGAFDPRDEYGATAFRRRARPESRRARDERKRGIGVPQPDCPMLVVAGADFADARGRRIADTYGAPLVLFPDHSHLALVEAPEVRRAIAGWIAASLPRR